MSTWKGQKQNAGNNQQNGYSEKTRGGLTPDYSRGLDFKITSVEITRYVNDIVDVVIAAYNKNAREKSEPQINSTGKCNLIQVTVSPIYKPLVCLIPEEWVVTAETLQKPGENSLWYQNRDEESNKPKPVGLYPCVHDILGQFFYTKKDVNAFYAPVWKKEHAVAAASSGTLKSYIIPKRYGIGDNSAVMVMLDPIRILYSMAASPADNGKRYVINNLKTQKQGKNNWGYTFTKLYVNSKKFKKDEVQRKLNSFLKSQFVTGGDVTGGNKNHNKHNNHNNNNFRYNNNNNKNYKKKKNKNKNKYYNKNY